MLLNNKAELNVCRSSSDSEQDYDREIADECEDYNGGSEFYILHGIVSLSLDITKKYGFSRFSNYRPNEQVNNGDYGFTSASRRLQTFKSGEAYIQQYMNEAGDKRAKKASDRSDRATVEMVLDPRTRLILFQLVHRKIINSVEGCVSTGKEANVYHATSDAGSLAIKIYRTSILTFKNRDKYVSGEFRYRNGYCRHNPRKMVAVWAEKELRNLQRIYNEGISVPKPIVLKGNILVMEFFGEDGWPAPTLKTAEVGQNSADKLYCECISIMHRLYNRCKLVHADLSEYNLLLHNDKLIVIDVSQSVEHDHPHSLQFLRKDIENITKFFYSKGAKVLEMKRLFELIVDSSLNGDFEGAINNERSRDVSLENQFFMNAFIPHKLDNIIHFERDDRLEKMGVEVNNPFQKIVGKIVQYDGSENSSSESSDVADLEQNLDFLDSNHHKGVSFADVEFTSISSSASSAQDIVKDSAGKSVEKNQRIRDESPNTKRARKNAVKQENRERRSHKIPKKLKRQKEKQSKKH